MEPDPKTPRLVSLIIKWFRNLLFSVRKNEQPEPKPTPNMNIIVKHNPWFSDRSRPVNGIIIHSMAEKIGGVPAAEFLESQELSAHDLIAFNGDLFECVDASKKARHAGKSEWQGQKFLNSSYIGIELLVPGDHTYSSFLDAIKKPESFSDQHYEICAARCRHYLQLFPEIIEDRFARHSDVSGPSVRPGSPKPDPGEGFDFDRLKSMVFSS